MIWEKIRGHSEQVAMFRRSIARGRLAHAYLFIGPEGVGKRTFAHALAQCLFCERFDDDELEACGECPSCRQMLAGTHPDFLTAGVPKGKSELPIEMIAGDREHRGRQGLCYELSLRPMSADRKVAVIDDANRMNEYSANALLKTLEEPPIDSVLMLIATNPDGLLPTIRSRCQQVRFAPLSTGDLADLLVELKKVSDRSEAALVASISEGSLGTAEELLEPDLRRLRETLYDHLAADEFDSLWTAEEMMAGLEEIGGDTQAQRDGARWLVRFCIAFFSQALRQLSAEPAAAGLGQDSGDFQKSPESESDNVVSAPVRRFTRRLVSLESGTRSQDASVSGRQPQGERSCEAAMETVVSLVERSALAERHLERHTPVPLCLHALFDELGRLMRSAVPA